MASLSLSLMLCLVILSSLSALILAQPGFTCNDCIYTRGNYTSTSDYSKNLNKLLWLMSSNTNIDNGFYKFKVGQGSNQVYGIASCKGDISVTDCRSCINDATKLLPAVCPTQKEAIAYYIDKCMLWYSDRPIFGTKERSPNCTAQNLFSIPDSDLEKFRKKLAIFLDALKNNASAGDSRLKYATGYDNVTAPLPLYGLMQCNPDLSQSDCSDCLQAGIRQLQSCCSTVVGANMYGPTCTIEFENYQFVKTPSTASSSPALSGHSLSKQGKRKDIHKKLIIIGLLFIMLIAMLALSLFFKRRRKLRNEVDNNVQIACVDSLQFVFSTIQVATDNFSNARKLGKESSTSTVLYKGILPNKQEIAVKKISNDSGYSELQFNNEVLLLAELQHRNLVKLIGFCVEKDSRLLIYEYLPNESLDLFLHDSITRAKLDWETRHKIILGIARGMLYLHEDSQLRVIHQDLKPSNILLDVQMNPKISNFKKAGLVQADQTRGGSSTVLGTYGYMPPEYAEQGHFSVKSDVFSFGVLLLEMIHGEMICSFSNGEEGESLPSFAWRKWFEGKALEVVDQTLPSIEKQMTQIMRCINIALLCVQEDPASRPTMSTVVFMMNSNLVTLAQPSRPAFNSSSSLHCKSYYQASINEASISELDPR